MDDSSMYTGVEGHSGQFGNEYKDEQLEAKVRDQEQLITELTPQMEKLIEMIDKEIEQVMSIDRFITAASKAESDIRAEVQASALYKQYLMNLKTRFKLTLDKSKG